jgi:hypothetical protein
LKVVGRKMEVGLEAEVFIVATQLKSENALKREAHSRIWQDLAEFSRR